MIDIYTTALSLERSDMFKGNFLEILSFNKAVGFYIKRLPYIYIWADNSRLHILLFIVHLGGGKKGKLALEMQLDFVYSIKRSAGMM